MIKSTTELNFDAREGEKTAIIQIEVDSWSTNKIGVTYTVNDYAVKGNIKELIGTVERFRSWEQLNGVNDYLMAIYDYSGLSKQAIEFLKVKQGLLIETQTKPVYGSMATNWVLTEDVEA